MNIDRAKMKCLDNSKEQQQRSAQLDKMWENQGQVQNYSAEEICFSDPVRQVALLATPSRALMMQQRRIRGSSSQVVIQTRKVT
ncbi:hypothetical protein PoB_004078700 [Plakobranchus ocellatus]|uniref:Uncharacterized protein n=1 Tax=Plakobranchus ocellatus TaxID=259542 RepID=A0AAV4B5B0_9GAST|nr:hypothetical protein PoB_004078700 [Plakobranchus ocellatus]